MVGRRRTGTRLGWGLAVLGPSALLAVASGLREPIGGSHVFRQSHVASNIEKFVERGLSLRPATYNENVPFSAFDLPLCQLAVASVCRHEASSSLSLPSRGREGMGPRRNG